METRTIQGWGIKGAALAAALLSTQPAWALERALAERPLAPDWLTVTWLALVSAIILGVALRLSIGALSALRLITAQAAQRARGQARVVVGGLVLLAMVFPYVVRQQPALAFLLLLGMGALAARGADARRASEAR